MLKWIHSLLRRTDGRVGYVYAAEAEAGPMQDAREGAMIRLPNRRPPWIVVDLDLSKTVVASWPGKLWRVRILEAASRRDQNAVGGPPNDQATYVRAISVEVIAEDSSARLFGPHGANLLPLLEAAAQLTRAKADALSLARAAGAAAAYDRVMRRWSKDQNIEILSDDLAGVLSVGGASPVNGALAVLHRTVFDQARATDGATALIEDHDGDVFLAEPWASAAQVMQDAALALGAPEVTDELDRHTLLYGWLRFTDASGAGTQI